MGIFIISIMIISLSFILRDLHSLLGSFENGEVLQFVSFSFILVLCIAGLFFVLVEKKDENISEPEISSILNLNFKGLGFNLVQGFLKGFSK